jgi:hypothetical protein
MATHDDCQERLRNKKDRCLKIFMTVSTKHLYGAQSSFLINRVDAAHKFGARSVRDL